MIPCANPHAQYLAHKDAIVEAVRRVLDGGHYVLGPAVEAFEKEFAQHTQVAHAIGLNSGTDALVLGLRALGVGPGDEVITVSHTALATVSAVVMTGATPVLVDVDPALYTLDPTKLAAAITPRTKAIIAVHLYGQLADIDAILAIAKARGIPVIEDCAQSTGARSKGRRAGSIGTLGCFSFYPTKNLGAIGDGGMLVTNDDAIAERVRRLRQYGWDARRATEAPGVNSRLDEIQAAILSVKLPSLDADNARRLAIAKRYGEGLAGLPVTLPAIRPETTHVFHLYVLECDDRDALKASLAKRDILAGIHYLAPAHRHGGYDALCVLPREGLPVTERLVGRILTLPMYPELTDAQVDEVIAGVRAHYS